MTMKQPVRVLIVLDGGYREAGSRHQPLETRHQPDGCVSTRTWTAAPYLPERGAKRSESVT